jgi:hypothetical protein
MRIQGASLQRLGRGFIVDHEGFQRRSRLEGVLNAFHDGAPFCSLSIHVCTVYCAEMVAAMYSYSPVNGIWLQTRRTGLEGAKQCPGRCFKDE